MKIFNKYIIYTLFFISIVDATICQELDSLVTKNTSKTYKLKEEVIVTSNFDNNNQQSIINSNSIDELLQNSKSLDLIKRGGYFFEPILRGSTSERLNVTIDGMHIMGACTDKMDPVSSYIEPENLDFVNVMFHESESATGQTAGSIDFKSKKINFNKKFEYYLSTFYATNSKANFNKGSILLSDSNYFFQGGIVIKKAYDFEDGNGDIINNSGVKKENYKLDFGYNYNNDFNLKTTYIYDNARDIGFPALIMDTRIAQSHIASIDLNFKNLLEYNTANFKIYLNKIHHIMDDFSRDTSEINNREVMPKMYMPMESNTSTFGLLSSQMIITENTLHKFNIDIYNLQQVANMVMIPINSNSAKMFLKNISDANQISSALKYSLSYNLNEEFIISFSSGINYLKNSLIENKDSKLFLDFINSISSVKDFWLISNSLSNEYKINCHTKNTVYLSYSERAPNILESYSYYVYNPMDNSFYFGNTNLRKEKSLKIENTFQYNSDDYNFDFSFYYNNFNDYILPYRKIDIKTDDEITKQYFMQNVNISRAEILGMNFSLALPIIDNLIFKSNINYTRGKLPQLNDNLPFIIPLVFRNNLLFTYNDLTLELNLLFNSSQSNISKFYTREDYSKSFWIVDINTRYKLHKNIMLKFNINNLFDRFYITHNSINNLPSQGRNVVFELQYFGL